MRRGGTGRPDFSAGARRHCRTVGRPDTRRKCRGTNAESSWLNRSYLTIDGGHWAGFMVYGNGEGVELYPHNPNHHMTIRNLEVFDNGIWPAGTPDWPGVSPSR